ncbi:MAG TPA: metalloregulator ArsR/SmtB family transcription factor [Rhizorhapis sp.]|nr:metalloregulator ArsR/SmtB family transcription factor [Rhizorhapis sp.]
MDNYSSLDFVFGALADPTRRAVVQRLGRGPASVKELAAPFHMALPSFMKHIAVLEQSGLVRSQKVGRVRTCSMEPKLLRTAEAWMAEQRALWEARTDRLADFVEGFRTNLEEKRDGRSE